VSEDVGAGYLTLPTGKRIRWQATGGRVKVETSQYCPEFGKRLPTQCITVTMSGKSDMLFELSW
jgi:hypothetical protein